MTDSLEPQIPREEWNPYFRRVYEHSAAQPGAWEDHPWEDHTVFKVGTKMFVLLPTPDRAVFTLKAHPDEVEALLAMPHIERAPYLGRYGWVQLTLENDEQLELALELIDTSYTLVSQKSRRRK